MFIVVIYTLYNQKIQLEIQNNPFNTSIILSKIVFEFVIEGTAMLLTAGDPIQSFCEKGHKPLLLNT